MTNKAESSFCLPRTIRDLRDILALVDQGLSNEEIFRRLPVISRDFSEIEKFCGKDFCAKCSQLIALDYCAECFQTLPRVQPDIFETKHEKRWGKRR